MTVSTVVIIVLICCTVVTKSTTSASEKEKKIIFGVDPKSEKEKSYVGFDAEPEALEVMPWTAMGCFRKCVATFPAGKYHIAGKKEKDSRFAELTTGEWKICDGWQGTTCQCKAKSVWRSTVYKFEKYFVNLEGTKPENFLFFSLLLKISHFCLDGKKKRN